MGVTVGVAGQGGGVLPQISGAVDLVQGLGDRLAGLQCLDKGQLFAVAADQLPNAVENAGTLHPSPAGPRARVERPASGGHGPVDILGAALGVAGHDDVVCRRQTFEGLAAECLDLLAVHDELVQLDVVVGDGSHLFDAHVRLSFLASVELGGGVGPKTADAGLHVLSGSGDGAGEGLQHP